MSAPIHFYCEPNSMEHYFYFEHIDNERRLEDLYALRYQVYCEERGFIAKQACPEHKEHDLYDAMSMHFGAYHLDGSIAGTVRLVRGTESKAMPLFEKCIIDAKLLPSDLSHENAAEISRLAVSKAIRRRKDDGNYAQEPKGNPPVKIRKGHRRNTPELILGLYKAMYHETKRTGLKYWFAAMEPSLAKLLNRFHFQFKEIGPEVDYYGMVKPYLADVEEIERVVQATDPILFERFTDELEPEYQPKLIRQAYH